jgi:transposase
MTRTDAKRRREEIAAAVNEGSSVASAAERFRVSPSLVRKACREFEIHYSPQRHAAEDPPSNDPSTEEVVASLRVGTSTADAAKHFQVSEERINTIQNKVAGGRK